ncbi:SulP family inorganic anion transporter [Cystobacter fuscus]
MGLYFDLDHEHTFTFSHSLFTVGPKFLVNLPSNLLSAITLPDFSVVLSATSIKYIVMFALVGSIESLLTAKAMDMMDPEKRRSDLDKDLLATGVGNFISGMLGGLPMISEVVRSSANIGYGAKSRQSNFFHGLFLLLFVAFVPMLIHRIPLAALAAMLIFAGVRLASPKEFVNTFRIGPEQFLIFTFTIGVTLATDLLVGVAAGIALKVVVHLINGAPFAGLFKPQIEEHTEAGRWYCACAGGRLHQLPQAQEAARAPCPRAPRGGRPDGGPPGGPHGDGAAARAGGRVLPPGPPPARARARATPQPLRASSLRAQEVDEGPPARPLLSA